MSMLQSKDIKLVVCRASFEQSEIWKEKFVVSIDMPIFNPKNHSSMIFLLCFWCIIWSC